MELATGALGTLVPKLAQLVKDEYHLHKSVREDIKSISRELEFIHTALCTVGEVPREQVEGLERLWVRDIRELSYDMEDAVDSFLVRVMSPDPPSKNTCKRFVKTMIEMVTKYKARHQIAEYIEDIKKRVTEISALAGRYNSMVRAIVHQPDRKQVATTMLDSRISALYSEVSDLVDIDKSSQELIKRVDEDGKSTDLRVVSIYGFGGLGKTTLAKVVHDHLKGQTDIIPTGEEGKPIVKKRYDCMAFVSVSKNPDMKKVFKNILYELDRINHENIHSSQKDVNQFIDQIKSFLGDKRYAIVVDDIWDLKHWEMIMHALTGNNKKSVIIMTTRRKDVAEKVGGSFELEALTRESSRKLFYKRLYGSEYQSDHSQFSEVSEKILDKCGGVPLAIITMSSLLATNKENIGLWTKVCESIGSGLGTGREIVEMRTILRLSYYDLPPYLKTCMLYLSIFPEDYVVRKDRLIWRWIAEDIVKNDRNKSDQFEAGVGYFNELINRGMIQPVSMDKEGNPQACRVHDIMLDVISELSRDENFVMMPADDIEQQSQSSGTKARRLSLQITTDGATPTMSELSQVRSFTGFSPATGSVPCLSDFRLLRVLDLEGCSIRENGSLDLKHVKKLLHLRYLGLRNTHNDVVPEEVGKLQYLEVLDIEVSQVRQKDFQILGSMPTLRFLYLHFWSESTEEHPLEKFTVSGGAFPSLRGCRLSNFVMVPSMIQQGAMPKLEFLSFCLRPLDFCNDTFDASDLALKHLKSLKAVAVKFLYDRSKPNEAMQMRRKIKFAMMQSKAERMLMQAAHVHPSHPVVSSEGYEGWFRHKFRVAECCNPKKGKEILSLWNGF